MVTSSRTSPRVTAFPRVLPGKCLHFVRVEDPYWSYEWCHVDAVRQFHREPDGSITTDYSLGRYNPDVHASMNSDTHPGFFHAYVFTGGQVRRVPYYGPHVLPLRVSNCSGVLCSGATRTASSAAPG
jgi:hypothetical protein